MHAYESEIDLKHGLFIAFEAKKKSERATGVGEQTDIWLVAKDRTTKISQEIMDKLNTIYKSKIKEEHKVMSKMQTMIDEIDMSAVIQSEEGHSE